MDFSSPPPQVITRRRDQIHTVDQRMDRLNERIYLWCTVPPAAIDHGRPTSHHLWSRLLRPWYRLLDGSSETVSWICIRGCLRAMGRVETILIPEPTCYRGSEQATAGYISTFKVIVERQVNGGQSRRTSGGPQFGPFPFRTIGGWVPRAWSIEVK